VSNAYAQVFTPEGELLGYSIYQGSADLVHPGIEAEFTWEVEWRSCGDEGKPCIVYEDYGGGCWFESRYCLEHRCLTGELSEWGDPVTGDGGLDPEVRQRRNGTHPFPHLKRCDLVGRISESDAEVTPAPDKADTKAK
jgi:hypothetical protein